jgi:hypothetical protein
VRDEGRRPPSSIKDEPPPWENPRSSSFSPSPSSACRPKTLAPASSSAAAVGIPKPRRAASKLRHGPLVLLVKRIELESSQSTPTSSVSQSPTTVDLEFLTTSDLSELLIAFLVS